MKNLTIRNVPTRLAEALDHERRRRDASLNSTVIDLLSRSLGVTDEASRRNGLAELAGTWSAEDLRAFDAAIAPLETVDEEMWA
jgi:kynureninase